MESGIVPMENITGRIVVMRQQRVLLDADLAALYGVSVKRLNEQVKRNRARFPEDFMFRLNRAEQANLRSQNATSSWGGQRHLPYAFTEHGALMAANVINSPQAAAMSVLVIRAFVQLRRSIIDQQALYKRVASLERKYDEQFSEVFTAIKRLMAPPETGKRKIGFYPPTQSTTPIYRNGGMRYKRCFGGCRQQHKGDKPTHGGVI